MTLSQSFCFDELSSPLNHQCSENIRLQTTTTQATAIVAICFTCTCTSRYSKLLQGAILIKGLRENVKRFRLLLEIKLFRPPLKLIILFFLNQLLSMQAILAHRYE